MLTQEKIVALLREHSPYLRAEYGVRRIGLFGSFPKGLADEASDVDVVVELERPLGFKFIELTDYLEQLLGRKVDVLTPTGLQGIRLPHVTQSIVRSLVYV